VLPDSPLTAEFRDSMPKTNSILDRHRTGKNEVLRWGLPLAIVSLVAWSACGGGGGDDTSDEDAEVAAQLEGVAVIEQGRVAMVEEAQLGDIDPSAVVVAPPWGTNRFTREVPSGAMGLPMADAWTDGSMSRLILSFEPDPERLPSYQVRRVASNTELTCDGPREAIRVFLLEEETDADAEAAELAEQEQAEAGESSEGAQEVESMDPSPPGWDWSELEGTLVSASCAGDERATVFIMAAGSEHRVIELRSPWRLAVETRQGAEPAG